MSAEDTGRRLVWHGMLLFLLGLFTGFVEPQFANVRMGLTAHVEGVMNGMFLVALGAAWSLLRLSARQAAVLAFSHRPAAVADQPLDKSRHGGRQAAIDRGLGHVARADGPPTASLAEGTPSITSIRIPKETVASLAEAPKVGSFEGKGLYLWMYS